MSRRTRLVIASACVLLAVLGLIFPLFRLGSVPSRKPIAWLLQPDSYRIGTVLQGSRVEMSLGLFSGLKPGPMPASIPRLPPPMRKAADWIVERGRALAVKLGLHVGIEAPAFLKLERTEVAVHTSQGPFVVISFLLNTDSPGDYQGNLVVHLRGSAYGNTNKVVPVTARVIAAIPSNAPAVLIAETPYECYATDNGKAFEPLAALNTRLAAKGVKVSFCRHLPGSLNAFRTILVAGPEMARLDTPQMKRLQEFVTGGGRLILAANAFFVPTVPKANTVLNSFGLQIVDQDAGQAITGGQVVSDLLTAGVNHVDFFRASLINLTDPSQGKLLVVAVDGQGGYVAVSREVRSGEVIVLTQSLWWSWIRSDPAKANNLLLLENLLVR